MTDQNMRTNQLLGSIDRIFWLMLQLKTGATCRPTLFSPVLVKVLCVNDASRNIGINVQ